MSKDIINIGPFLLLSEGAAKNMVDGLIQDGWTCSPILEDDGKWKFSAKKSCRHLSSEKMRIMRG